MVTFEHDDAPNVPQDSADALFGSPHPVQSDSQNGGIYEFNALSVLGLYHEFVEGTPNDTMLVISSDEVDAAVRTALLASAERLGYGRSCAWVRTTLTPAAAASNTPANAPTPAAAASNTPSNAPTPAAATDVSSASNAVPATDKNLLAETESLRLGASDLKAIIEGIDPIAIVLTDAMAAAVFSKAYSSPLKMNAFERVFCRPIAVFSDFRSSLQSESSKRQAWHVLKHLKR